MEKIAIVNTVVGMILMFSAIGLAFQISSYFEARKGLTAGKYNDWFILLILPFAPIIAIASMCGITQYFLRKNGKETVLSIIVGILAWMLAAVNYWGAG